MTPATRQAGAISPAAHRALVGIAVGALVLTILGWVLDQNRAAAGLLVAGQFVLGISLAGLVLMALLSVLGAGWASAIRRIPEAMAGTLPVTAFLMFVALLLALPVYEWMDATRVEHSPLIERKTGWLNAGGVIFRAAIYLLLWVGFARALRATSLRQDLTGDISETRRAVTLSCGFLAVFAVTWSLASFDWLMSIEAEWFSTVYAIYTFSGVFLAGLAVVAIALILLERAGPLRGVLRADHLHDLGKLMFGFATFWAYIWFCQYMLIWYSDMPEETSYYIRRFDGAWGPMMVLNLAVNWAIPFLLLLPRANKRSRSMMLKVAALLLVGRWLDLHLLVMPGVDGGAPYAVWWELTAIGGFLAITFLAGMRVLRSAPIVPKHDPYMEESLHYHA